MSLHIYCSKYGRYTPQKLPSQFGALKFNMPNYMLENFLEKGFEINEISAIICVAERTICRQLNEYNLSKISFRNDSGAGLDKKVHEICIEFPWWRMTMFGAVNGFSRLPVSLKCVSNNKSDTLLSCFMKGLQTYGILSRCDQIRGKRMH